MSLREIEPALHKSVDIYCVFQCDNLVSFRTGNVSWTFPSEEEDICHFWGEMVTGV